MSKVSLVEMTHLVDLASRGEGTSFDMLVNAVRIADEAARTDIECCAHQQQVNGVAGHWIYSITEMRRLRATMTDAEAATQPFASDLAEALDMLDCTQRAARHIEQRGNVFPWRMVDVPDMPGWVRFVDKEGRPVDPGSSDTTHNNRSNNEAIEAP